MADVFKGLFDAGDWTEGSLPMIHCYLFARTVETAEDIVKVRFVHSRFAAIWRHPCNRRRSTRELTGSDGCTTMGPAWGVSPGGEH
jgi:hypothetical protein